MPGKLKLDSERVVEGGCLQGELLSQTHLDIATHLPPQPPPERWRREKWSLVSQTSSVPTRSPAPWVRSCPPHTRAQTASLRSSF